MQKVDLLERFYNAFIKLEKPRDFFLGLADYLSFLDNDPEFDRITGEILAERDMLAEKLASLEKNVLPKLASVHKALSVYITQNKIEAGEILEAITGYDARITRKITGSWTLPQGLYGSLHDVVERLYQMPEHKEFASKYIKFSDAEKLQPSRYLPMQEYADYLDQLEEIKRQQETALWGQVDEIAWLYDVMRHGRDRRKQLVEELKEQKPKRTLWDLVNYNGIVQEWVAVEENNQEGRNFFFKIDKVRPMVTRLHNQILVRTLSPSSQQPSTKALTNTENKQIPASFSPQLITEDQKGYLQIFKQSKKHCIGGVNTRKFKLVKCLFSPENSLIADYSSIFQTVDRIFKNIRLPKDSENTKLRKQATAAKEMHTIIEFTIKEIQKIAPLQGYLKFTWEKETLKMEIIPPLEGKLAVS